MEDVFKSKMVIGNREGSHTNKRDRHASTISNTKLIKAMIFRVDAEVAQIRCNVISCATIQVPIRITKG